jgi:hypothetical protein
MNEIRLSDLSFPLASRLVFDKVVWTDWYDGLTSGVVFDSRTATAFRLDILAWGSAQMQRIFVLSPFDVHKFERIVTLLAGSGAPAWPNWDPAWPQATPENEPLRAEIETLLKSAGSPEYVIASEASFEIIYGAKELDGPALDLLPTDFDGLPFRDNFDYWKEYIGLQD